MGTITSRKREDNSTAYTAQIRINRDGKTVYQESQTFDGKQVAQVWIKLRETELAEPGRIGIFRECPRLRLSRYSKVCAGRDHEKTLPISLAGGCHCGIS